MKISATSALVLNWTHSEIWQSPAAKAYNAQLDLSEGDNLLSQFSEHENYMHTQSVSNRKYFVRKKALEFATQHAHAQFLIMGAGIAPLSVEIASLYPTAKVFDIDRYLMDDKKAMLNNQFENIHFITCDLNQHQELESLLKENGWQPQHPSLIILEGIIYYLDKNALMGLLQFFADKNVALCGDFALTPETVSEQNRKFGTGVFQKISRSVGDITVQFYDPNAFIKMLDTWG